jgi:hypothetical protein
MIAQRANKLNESHFHFFPENTTSASKPLQRRIINVSEKCREESSGSKPFLKNNTMRFSQVLAQGSKLDVQYAMLRPEAEEMYGRLSLIAATAS